MNVEKMYPMDFEEFCIANKVSQVVMDHLKTCFEQVTLVDVVIHETILKLYYLYLIVGCCEKWNQIQSFRKSFSMASRNTQIQLLNKEMDINYGGDFRKCHCAGAYEP